MNEAQALVRLQEIDLSLIRYDGEIRKLPQLKKLAAIKQAQKKLAQDMTKIVGQRKDAELELKDNEDMTERLKQHEEEVTAEANEDGHTPRELQDFENQLTMLARMKD